VVAGQFVPVVVRATPVADFVSTKRHPEAE
jgi:hypothetical protein